MGGFRARRRGGVTARFAGSQASIIRALVSQVEELIAGPAGEDGGRVELTEEDAQVWLRALNDVRLALGVRLDITEDTAQRTQDLDPADPRSAYLWVYDWLTYLQETLVRALW